jgi:GH35 family endo-1,4-beta-xylanase/subtilisin family serine protease/subtilisin-like proprotein convertase family protein
MRRQNKSPLGRGLSSMLAGRARRPRKSTFSFEQLEDRYLMTATPISGFESEQVVTISNQTPEGQQLIRLFELDAALKAFGSSGNGTSIAPLSLPTDPDLIQQWNLLNVGQVVNYGGFQNIYGTPGQDINVLPAWNQGITGEGILVAVVDTGVQSTHPDLQGNINLVYALNAVTGSSNATPTGTSAAAAHGTEVAGLIGAIAGNGLGGVGVAYGSTIVPIKLLDNGLTFVSDQAIVNAILAGGAPVDIFNHSWGPFDPENPRAASGPSTDVLNALINSATAGRGGLGAIHVFAAGNAAGPQFSPGFQDIGFYDTMGSNGFANSRYVISVGAVDHDGSIFNADGTLSIYGEAGTSLLVVAPSASGPFDIATNLATGSGIFTTDLTTGGNNVPTLPNGVSPDVDRFPDSNYTTRFGGTSAAAPLVSGVIALMLEADKAANNGVATLSYRDVQEILVRSARQNDPNDLSWIVNSTPHFYVPTYPADGINYIIMPGEMEDDQPTVERAPGDVGYKPVPNPRTRTFPSFMSTNGAGYTVSQGWMTDFANEYGFGHGVIDAELAVQLASQWHSKEQTLAPELTVLNLVNSGQGRITAAQVIEATMAPGDSTLVPGALWRPGIDPTGDGNFADYYQEFYKIPTIMEGEEGDPDADPPVPPTEDMFDPMSLPFGGEMPPANDRGSPLIIDGPSDMSIEWVEVQMDISYSDANALDFLRIVLVSPSGTQSELTHYQYTGNYNISSGDQQYFRGTADLNQGSVFVYGEVDPPGVLDLNLDENDTFSWTYSTNRHWGERSEGTWQLDFENYGEEDLNLLGTRLIFHGQAITGGRSLGFVDDTSGYLGHGSNVTVYVKDSAGNRVDQFVTGADGNYYFDVIGGNYTLGIDVPAGYHLNSENDVPLQSGFRFSISPDAPISHTATLSGQVFADFDGDGVQNAQDGGVKNVVVYADVNHTGQFELGEPNTLTDQNGNYSFQFTLDHSTIITVGVKTAPGWTTTNPASGFRDQLVELGVGDITHVNFGIKPPAVPTGQGNASIYGFVYNDVNGDGNQQDSFEFGIAGLTVFIDANQDGVFQADGPDMEVSAITSETGAYQFFDIPPTVAPDKVRVAVNVDEDAFQITNPLVGYLDIMLVAGQVSSENTFGIRDLRIYDFGDLVGIDFRTTLAQDGARNYVIPGFSLGSRVDAEVDARIYDPDTDLIDPALNGVGDNLDGPEDANDVVINDEDGVVLVGGVLRRGSNLLDITVQGVGGYLQGWIDFNNNGMFEDSERVFNNLDINPGLHHLTITAPDTLLDGQVAARFRWGSINKNYFGTDILGEVEDHLFTAKAAITPGDFNSDDLVNNADYNLWKQTFGSTTDLRADANHSGRVDLGDYTIWRNNLGSVAQQQLVGGSSLALNSGSTRLAIAQLDDNGYVGTYITLAAPGDVTVTANAWGTPDGGVNPHMNIVIADMSANFDVSSGFHNYAHTFSLPAGTYFVRTEFTNDGGTARALTIATLNVSGATTLNDNSNANALSAADTYVENFRKGLAEVTLVGAVPGTEVEVQLKRHAFNFGANLPGTSLAGVTNGRLDNPQFTDFFKAHFNMVVPSNAGKWDSQEGGSIQPAMPNLGATNAILDFAEANNMRARMHNMIWGNQQPGWVNSLIALAVSGDPTALNDLNNAIDNRIDYYVRDQAERYLELDVYNESVHTGVNNFNSYWTIYGAPGIADIFDEVAQAVADAGSEAKLYVNEYNILQNGFDSYGNWYREHIEDIQNADGNPNDGPISGIGMQYYAVNGHAASYMQQVLQNLSVTGLPLSLTEFGVQGSVTNEAVASQIVTEALRMIFGTPDAQTFMYWGFWEGARDANLQGASELVDVNWNLTTVGNAWLGLMNSWDTNETLVVGANGKIDFRGFYGDYELTIGGNSYDLSLEKGMTQYSIAVGGSGSAASALAESSPLSAELTGTMGGSTSDSLSPEAALAATLDLDAMQFSATIKPSASSAVANRSASAAADRADTALLLLAVSDGSRGGSGSVGDAFDADTDWLRNDGRDTSAALALAFGEQGDWWKSL